MENVLSYLSEAESKVVGSFFKELGEKPGDEIGSEARGDFY